MESRHKGKNNNLYSSVKSEKKDFIASSERAKFSSEKARNVYG